MLAEQAPTYNQISTSTSTFGQTTAFTEPERTNKAPETIRLPAEQAPTCNHISASIEPEKTNGALETTWMPDNQASTCGRKYTVSESINRHQSYRIIQGAKNTCKDSRAPDNTFKDTGEPENIFRDIGVPVHNFRNTGISADTFRSNVS